MHVVKKLIIVWCLPVFGLLMAMPVSKQDAEQIAKHWMQSKFRTSYSIKHKLYATQKRSKMISANSNYTVVQFEPTGWAIVSLDDATRPILAYGNSRFDTQMPPPALVSILQSYDRYVGAQKKKFINQPNFKWVHQWNQLKSNSLKLYATDGNTDRKLYSSGDYDYVVRPLLWLGSTSDTEDQGIRWDQGTYYNAYTPVDENGDHTPTGCIATAIGQIMRYWKYPDVGIGEHCYTPEEHPEYGEQCANFGETTYDWENMPLTLTSENDAVAEALYHIGVSVDMDYSPEGSGAWYGDSLKRYFGYKLYIYSFPDIFIHEEMHKFLDNGLPLLVAGSPSSGVGHAYILDGYDSDGYYHANLGWGGYSNGKYLITDVVDYNTTSYLVAAPSDPSEQVEISDENFEACIMEKLEIGLPEDIREWTLAYYNDWQGLDCSNQSIFSADEISYFKNVWDISLSDNSLSGDIDLTENTNLEYLYINNNMLASIALPSNNHLKSLSIDNNNLSGELNLSNERNLAYLSLDNNQLDSIVFPNNDHLRTLFACYNHLSGTLDLSNEANLTSIYLSDNNLSTLILAENSHIDIISVSSNANLDITEIENLKNIDTLYAYGTKSVLCASVEALKADNNITNIYIDCNHPPVALEDNVTTPVNIEVIVDVTNNDSDEDWDILTGIDISSQPLHGTATISDNKIIYTPETDYVGSDSLTYPRFKMSMERGAMWRR